jgi:predicted DNA-binding transcriptional regulator YafY
VDETNPTARALRALQLLQDHPGITAARLGERLGVSDRAARRYVAILREAEVPVESVRGPYGGYRLGRGLRLPPVVFNSGEALALVMAVLHGHHAADSGDPVGLALDKIMRALPAPVGAEAEAVRRTATPAPDRSAALPDAAATTTLVQACAEHRRVRLGYRTERGSERRVMEVDPWAVVVRHGRWYLLCWSHTAGDRRAYRIDRVVAPEVLDAVFVPPDDLDPVADLEAHLAVGWAHATEVLVEAPLETVGRRLPRSLGRLEAVDERTTRLVGSTDNPGWYAEQLAACAAAYRVVGGPELRAATRDLGRRVLDAAGPG